MLKYITCITIYSSNKEKLEDALNKQSYEVLANSTD